MYWSPPTLSRLLRKRCKLRCQEFESTFYHLLFSFLSTFDSFHSTTLSRHVISLSFFFTTSLFIYTFAGRFFFHCYLLALHHGKKLHNTKYFLRRGEEAGAILRKMARYQRQESPQGVRMVYACMRVVWQAVRHMFECVERFCLNSRSNLTSGLNLFHHFT